MITTYIENYLMKMFQMQQYWCYGELQLLMNVIKIYNTNKRYCFKFWLEN